MILEQPLFQLQTPRLILRDFVEADWPLIYTLSLEPQVTPAAQAREAELKPAPIRALTPP
jgi:hypothetical protein